MAGPSQIPAPADFAQISHGHFGVLLDCLPEDSRAALRSIARCITLARGACLLAHGTQPSDIGFVLEGALGMEKGLADGRMHIVGLLVPTDMYGRLFDGYSPYDIVALSDARVLSFPRAAFEAVLGPSPDLEQMFLVSVLDELDAAREWVLLMGARRVVQRVAAFLLILQRRKLRITPPGTDGRGARTITIPLRRSDLARYLGTTPESISRALRDLATDGVIDLRDAQEVEILDMAALVRVGAADHLNDTPG